MSQSQKNQEFPQYSPSNHVPLVSVRGVNYEKLRDLLATGKWKEADEETERCMLKVARREKEGWLRIEDIDNFSCEDLRTIDQLWIKYSNGKFGFSVQKQIYQNMGGTRQYDSQIWEAFCDTVGWRQRGKWLYWDDLTFSLDTDCTGHLPVGLRPQWVRDYGIKSFLAQRLVDCKI